MLVALALAISVVGCSGEAKCESDGGRVVTHTFTGNKWCDFFPYAENLSELSGRDYIID